MNMTTSMMFLIVSQMNTAFGNPKGNPAHIMRNLDTHLAQCKNIGAEFLELMRAFGVHASLTVDGHTADNGVDVTQVRVVDIDAIRDALCDIMVFDLGAFHRMGIDADADMATVVDAVMTRFCKDEADLEATRAKYNAKGIEFTEHGEFPRMFLRSAHDQHMPEFPKGKFLKSASFREPVFTPLPEQQMEDPMEEMAKARAKRMAEDAAWLQWRKERVAQLDVDLDSVPDDRRMQFVRGELTLSLVVRPSEAK